MTYLRTTDLFAVDPSANTSSVLYSDFPLLQARVSLGQKWLMSMSNCSIRLFMFDHWPPDLSFFPKYLYTSPYDRQFFTASSSVSFVNFSYFFKQSSKKSGEHGEIRTLIDNSGAFRVRFVCQLQHVPTYLVSAMGFEPTPNGV